MASPAGSSHGCRGTRGMTRSRAGGNAYGDAIGLEPARSVLADAQLGDETPVPLLLSRGQGGWRERWRHEPDRTARRMRLSREAMLLDTGDWDDWLDLYTEDAIFWMPAWRDEGIRPQIPTASCRSSTTRGAEPGRPVWRALGPSVALDAAAAGRPQRDQRPRPAADDPEAKLSASFTVHHYDVRAERTHVFFGR